MTEADPESLWPFALRLYAAPGVAEACLALQDAEGVDVPLLIFAAWMARHGTVLRAADVKRLDGIVAGWRSEVIGPLRQTRRYLKSATGFTPSRDVEALRTAVKSAELAAEKIELAKLEAEGLTLLRTASSPHRAVAAEHLLTLVRHFHPSAADDDSRIAAIAAAASAL